MFRGIYVSIYETENKLLKIILNFCHFFFQCDNGYVLKWNGGHAFINRFKLFTREWDFETRNTCLYAKTFQKVKASKDKGISWK